MRSRALLLLCASILLAAPAGCARDEKQALAPACREGSDPLLRALRRAPSPVSLGGTRLSSCLRDASDGGELQAVGQAYVDAASTLARAAQRAPEGPEALQLGYLIGAVHRGGDSAQGPAAELVRRLDTEVARADTGAAAFRRGRREGSRTG